MTLVSVMHQGEAVGREMAAETVAAAARTKAARGTRAAAVELAATLELAETAGAMAYHLRRAAVVVVVVAGRASAAAALGCLAKAPAAQQELSGSPQQRAAEALAVNLATEMMGATTAAAAVAWSAGEALARAVWEPFGLSGRVTSGHSLQQT